MRSGLRGGQRVARQLWKAPSPSGLLNWVDFDGAAPERRPRSAVRGVVASEAVRLVFDARRSGRTPPGPLMVRCLQAAQQHGCKGPCDDLRDAAGQIMTWLSDDGGQLLKGADMQPSVLSWAAFCAGALSKAVGRGTSRRLVAAVASELLRPGGGRLDNWAAKSMQLFLKGCSMVNKTCDDPSVRALVAHVVGSGPTSTWLKADKVRLADLVQDVGGSDVQVSTMVLSALEADLDPASVVDLVRVVAFMRPSLRKGRASRGLMERAGMLCDLTPLPLTPDTIVPFCNMLQLLDDDVGMGANKRRCIVALAKAGAEVFLSRLEASPDDFAACVWCQRLCIAVSRTGRNCVGDAAAPLREVVGRLLELGPPAASAAASDGQCRGWASMLIAFSRMEMHGVLSGSTAREAALLWADACSDPAMWESLTELLSAKALYAGCRVMGESVPASFLKCAERVLRGVWQEDVAVLTAAALASVGEGVDVPQGLAKVVLAAAHRLPTKKMQPSSYWAVVSALAKMEASDEVVAAAEEVMPAAPAHFPPVIPPDEALAVLQGWRRLRVQPTSLAAALRNTSLRYALPFRAKPPDGRWLQTHFNL